MTSQNKHYTDRCQQRCISDAQINVLKECGVVTYSKGRRILHLQSKRAWRRAQAFMAHTGMLPDNHLRKVYLVVAADGEFVTTGWRDKRILRDWNDHKNRNRRKKRR